nr:hypothetical protein [Bradyrhizobium sp. KBS0725]
MTLGADEIDSPFITGRTHGADGRGSRLPRPHNETPFASARVCSNAACPFSGRARQRCVIRGQRRLRCYRRRIQVDKYRAVLDLHCIGFDIFRQRRAKRLAGANIKQSLMQRTFDPAAFDKSIGEEGQRMGANPMGRVDLIAKLIKSDWNAVDFDAGHTVVA